MFVATLLAIIGGSLYTYFSSQKPRYSHRESKGGKVVPANGTDRPLDLPATGVHLTPFEDQAGLYRGPGAIYDELDSHHNLQEVARSPPSPPLWYAPNPTRFNPDSLYEQNLRQLAAERQALLSIPPRATTEPPIFNYERFMDEAVPSDLRFKYLFPHDIDVRTRCRDAKTECELLRLYNDYIVEEQEDPRNMRSIPRYMGRGLYFYDDDHSLKNDEEPIQRLARQKFYEGLKKEVEFDFMEVAQEERTLYLTASVLGKWEYEWLDNKGKLTKLEDWMRHLHIIPMCPEAFEKYMPLLIKLDGGRDYFENYAWYYARKVMKEDVERCKARIAKASSQF